MRLVDKISHLDKLKKTDLAPNSFSIVNSAWLAIMGIRSNRDLDLLVTNSLRHKYQKPNEFGSSFGVPPHESLIRALATDSYYSKFDCGQNSDYLISNLSVTIDDIRFIQPSLYFQYKIHRYQQQLPRKPIHIFVRLFIRRFYSLRNTALVKQSNKFFKDRDDLIAIKQYFAQNRHAQFDKKTYRIDWGTTLFEELSL